MKNLLRYSPSIIEEYSGKTIILDTAALVDASKVEEFGELLARLVDGGCNFRSTSDVYFEFMRGAKTTKKVIEFKQFLESLGVEFRGSLVNRIYSVDGMLFNLAVSNCFSRAKNVPSLTDVMLMLELFVNRDKEIYLMTANHKDIPAKIFDRTELIVFENNGEIRTEALYSLNKTRLGKLFGEILDDDD